MKTITQKIKRFLPMILVLALLIMPFSANAQITAPHPYVDFSGIFTLFLPICLNGAIVKVLSPIPLLLLFPYVPISPIVPVFKLWGPIPLSTTAGSFMPGGVCLIKTFGGLVAIPLMGTLIQIGTTAGPNGYVPAEL